MRRGLNWGCSDLEEMLATADILLDPDSEQWQRMHAVQDLDRHGRPALPYLFEASNLDWSQDPAMLSLIGDSIANIWREAGILMTAPVEGLPPQTIDQIEAHRDYFRKQAS